MPEQWIALIDEIIHLRWARGWSQRDLAAACGMTQSVIARIESKKSVPTIATLYRIVDALDSVLVVEKKPRKAAPQQEISR